MTTPNKEELIKGAAAKFKMPEQDVQKEWDSVEATTRSLLESRIAEGKITEEEVQERVSQRFVTYFLAKAKTDAIQLEGVIDAQSPLDYPTKRYADTIMKKYNENPTETVAAGYVKIIDGQPIPVDSRAKFHAGTDKETENPQFGQPLDINNVETEFRGVAEIDGKPKNFIMKARNKYALQLKAPIGVPVKFMAKVLRSIDENTVQLVPRPVTKFEASDRKMNFAKIFEGKYSTMLVDIGDIDKVVAESRQKQEYNKLVLVKGQVTNMNLNPQPGKDISIELLQEAISFESDITSCFVKVPKHLANLIDFGTQSVIYVLGNPWSFDGDNGKVRGITAHSILVVERMMPTEVQPAQKGDVSVTAPEGGTFKEFEDPAFDGGE